MTSPSRQVELLYFAALRDRVGLTSERLDLPDTVRDIAGLASYLVQLRPGLAGALGGVRFAVGERFVASDQVLHPGDVVALIPPVSGG